jgi:hypothetical protein
VVVVVVVVVAFVVVVVVAVVVVDDVTGVTFRAVGVVPFVLEPRDNKMKYFNFKPNGMIG